MNTKLRDLIKQRLKDKNITQVDLADMVGLTAPQISRIISGDRGTSLDNLISIADALQIKRGYFLQVAAGSLPDPDKDQWVEDTAHKLSLLPPSFRGVADKFINALLEGEQDSNTTNTKPKKTAAKA